MGYILFEFKTVHILLEGLKNNVWLVIEFESTTCGMKFTGKESVLADVDELMGKVIEVLVFTGKVIDIFNF